MMTFILIKLHYVGCDNFIIRKTGSLKMPCWVSLCFRGSQRVKLL